MASEIPPQQVEYERFYLRIQIPCKSNDHKFPKCKGLLVVNFL